MSNTKELTITQALAELKMLGKRIESAVSEFVPVGVSVGKSGVVQGYKTNEEYIQNVKSKWDQVNQLIRNKSELKAAVVHSNAVTEVTIGSEKMTVAAAIERKNSIKHDKMLLERMKQVFQSQSTTFEKYTQILNNKKDEVIYSGKSSDQSDETLKRYFESQIELTESMYTPTLHDPLDLKVEIEKLENKITEFETNVDYVLSVSNATTKIEIEV